MFKKLKKILRVGVPLAILVAIIYAIAYGETVNRIFGANVTPGDGLIKHADSTAFHILHSAGYLYILSDSIMFDFTQACADSLVGKWNAQTISGAKEFSESLLVSNGNGLIIGKDGTDGRLTIYSEQNGTDYKLIFKPNASMAQNCSLTFPINDGSANQYLKTDGDGNLTWDSPAGSGDIEDVWNCASGDCNTPTIGESEKLDGGVVDGSTDPSIILPHGTSASSEANTEGSIYWNSSTDNLYIGSGASSILFAKMSAVQTEIEDSLNEYAMLDDPTFTTGITVPNNSISDEELDEGATFTWTGTQDFSGATVSGLSEGDVTFNSSPMYIGNTAVRAGVDDNVNVLYPLADDDHHWYCYGSNSSGSNDLYDTLVVSGFVSADLDSVVWDLKTSSTTTDVASIKMLLYKQSKVGATSTSIYTGSETSGGTANVWDRVAIGGGSISAISAGDKLIAYMIRRLDNNENGSWGMPVAYCSGK